MALIRNLVPYEIRIVAKDIKSGKLISNLIYYKSDDAGGGYGVPIAASSQATFSTAVIGMWNTFPMSRLSINYETIKFVQQAIVGRRYPTPLISITGLSALLTGTRVTTASPHGFLVGQPIMIQNVTTPSTINATFVVTAVASSTEFDIAYTLVGLYAGPGVVQKMVGAQQFQYADRYEELQNNAGSIAGEATPIFNSVSMRRPSAGIGRNWRSRLSMAIIPESDQQDGRLTAAALAAWTTVGQGMDNAQAHGGGNMQWIVVSKQLAFAQPTPFTESSSWTQIGSPVVPQPNLGSMVKRKPRLSAVIA